MIDRSLVLVGGICKGLPFADDGVLPFSVDGEGIF